MQRLAVAVLLCLTLAGCGGVRLGFPGVYRIDVAQGNIVTQEMIDKLKPGMTKRQVRFVMGSPLVIDTFTPERWDYVYRYARAGELEREERVSLFFENDVLARISGTIPPSTATNDSNTVSGTQP